MFGIAFALLSAAISGQPAPEFGLTGEVRQVEKGRVQVKSGTRSVTVVTDQETEVCADGGLPGLEPGRRIRVEWREGGVAGLAQRISEEIEVHGYVTVVDKDKFAVGNGASRRVIRLSLSTQMAVSKRQIAIGQEIRATGWDACGGAIEAERIIVYNTDVPISERFRDRQDRR